MVLFTQFTPQTNLEPILVFGATTKKMPYFEGKHHVFLDKTAIPIQWV